MEIHFLHAEKKQVLWQGNRVLDSDKNRKKIQPRYFNSRKSFHCFPQCCWVYNYKSNIRFLSRYKTFIELTMDLICYWPCSASSMLFHKQCDNCATAADAAQTNMTKWHIYIGNCLTHWGRDKMDAIFQTTFSNGFSWMKMYEFRLTFHWSLFLGVQLTIFQHLFR